MRQSSPRNLGNSARNPVGGGLERIVGQMGVAGGGLNLVVPEQLAEYQWPASHERAFVII